MGKRVEDMQYTYVLSHTAQVHPKTKTAEQDELSSLLQVPIVVGVLMPPGNVATLPHTRYLKSVCCAL